jgi:DNA-binding MarR family transcriptional regulator
VKYPSKAKLEALDQVIAETLLLSQRLRAVAEEIHAGQSVTASMRSVMASLDENGPQTVPQIARTRSVSRQNVQTLVNRLLEDGLARLEENPAHRRSSLVALTARGKEKLVELIRQERRLLSQMPIGISKKELRNAAATLRSVGELFDSQRWRSLVQG